MIKGANFKLVCVLVLKELKNRGCEKWEFFCGSMENWRILWEYGNGCASGRVFPQEVVRHLFPRPRDPSEWSAGQGRGGGAKKNSRKQEEEILPYSPNTKKASYGGATQKFYAFSRKFLPPYKKEL